MYRIVPRFPAPGHAPRKNPQVRVRVLLPVHRPGSHHRAIQTTRVQASVRDKAATDKISDKPNATLSGLIFRFFAILGCYTAKSEPKNASNSPINDYIGPHSRKSA